jgi:hypothetical protein
MAETEPKPRRSQGRFPKGASGNPSGRPPGSRNKNTLLMEALLDEEGESLTRKAIALAKKGDVTALRLCLERLLPPRKDRLIQLDLPDQLPDAVSTVVEAIAAGQITPGEGEVVANILAIQNQIVDTAELVRRIEQLENSITPLPPSPATEEAE